MVGTAQAAGDAAAGKAKAAACAGATARMARASAPIRHWQARAKIQIVQAMQDYKSGKRANAIMKGMVRSLSDADMANLAAYLCFAEEVTPVRHRTSRREARPIPGQGIRARLKPRSDGPVRTTDGTDHE